MTPPPVVVVGRPAALRHVPLALVWLAAAWPAVLWLVHRQDPEAAVRLAQIAGALLVTTLQALGGLGLAAALLFPPFPAWLRLAGSRALLTLQSDRGPLLKALADLRHFESAPRHLEAGRLLRLRGELPAAGNHLVRAIELDPGLAGAHHQLGLLLLRVGQLPGALAAFERTVGLDPGHAFGDAQLMAGRCRFLLGDRDGALQALRRHAGQHGGSRKSHYWLGQALAAAGDAAAAAEAFRYAAAPAAQRLTAEENWFRALARVRLWRSPRR